MEDTRRAFRTTKEKTESFLAKVFWAFIDMLNDLTKPTKRRRK